MGSSADNLPPRRRARLFFELAALYGGLPACAFLLQNIPPLCFVWAGGVIAAFIAPGRISFKNLRPGRMTAQALIGAALLLIPLIAFTPDALFELPRRAPLVWLLFLLLYPFVSVIPQEFFYRHLFFTRYAALFPYRLQAPVNALLFSGAHLIFGNWPALLLTFGGGFLFSGAWRRGGIGAAILQHILWGSLLFSIGYSRWFTGVTLSTY